MKFIAAGLLAISAVLKGASVRAAFLALKSPPVITPRNHTEAAAYLLAILVAVDILVIAVLLS